VKTIQFKLLNKDEFVSADLLARHESLFKTYYKPLVVFATRLIRDRLDAEDIVQEVFAQIWKKKEKLEYGEKISSYLFGAVKNACLNNVRHLKVIQRYEHEAKYRTSIIENPHHYMMLQEIEQKIDATLNTLPKKTKDVFLMSRYEQKKNREIADVLNISIKMVEAHMSKVLAALRSSLRHYISTIIIIILNT
jgi:RNA polymerase sigma-70 factor (ECF subfamily)